MAAQVARFGPKWNPFCRNQRASVQLLAAVHREVAAVFARVSARHDNARARRALAGIKLKSEPLRVVATCGDALNVRAVEADIGKFAIAELGQFVDVALVIPERLDHEDE
jgi:hypothetical protein